MRLFYPFYAIIFLFGVLLFCCGCTDQTSVDTTTANNAFNAIKEIESEYSQIKSDYSQLLQYYQEAEANGVLLNSSSPLYNSLNQKLLQSVSNYEHAVSDYNNKNYQSALNNAQKSIEAISRVQTELPKLRTNIQNDYQNTALFYKPQLSEAELQYRIAQRYVTTLEKYNVDVSNSELQLQEISKNLESMKIEYQSNNYKNIPSRVKDITLTSETIQKDLTEQYYHAVIGEYIQNIQIILTDDAARSTLSQSKIQLTNNSYNESINLANKALFTEKTSILKSNLATLTEYSRQHDLGITNYPHVISKLSQLESRIEQGQLKEIEPEINNIKNSLELIEEVSSKIVYYNEVTEQMNQLQFFWAQPPETNKAELKITEAKSQLSLGQYQSARAAANEAITTQKESRIHFWENVRSDWLLNIFYSIQSVFSEPEKIEDPIYPKPEVRQIPTISSLSFDFSKPLVDDLDFVIDEPTTPAIIVSSTSTTVKQTKKPVEFSLNPGTPTECGLTCRETTATISNIGDEVAHSVCVSLEVFNEDGERIYLNSGPSIQRCIGDLNGRASKTESIRIEADCGFLATKCIGHTLILKGKVTSDEKTQQFPDQIFSV